MRSLAQNSAAAAKEIKGLITTSVEQIQAGAVQVQSAGSTMDDIVTSSHRVTEIMGEVVQASLAQSSKLGDVTEDITAMTADAAQVLRQSTAERELRPVSVVKPVAQGVRRARGQYAHAVQAGAGVRPLLRGAAGGRRDAL